MLVGMLKPTSGSITIKGFDNQLQIEKVRHFLGYCPQYGNSSIFHKSTNIIF